MTGDDGERSGSGRTRRSESAPGREGTPESGAESESESGLVPEQSGKPDLDRPALADRRGVDRVYEPAEDSRLLAETVEGRIDRGDRVLDVGTGSGYVAERVRSTTGARVVGSDLNPHACRRAHAAGLPVVRADLTSAFRADAFDVVLFNPPYLPTDDDEWGDWMAVALSGGADGRAAVDPFLADVGRVLAPGGRAYLLVSTLTDPGAVREAAVANGLSVERLAAESYPFERLLVLALSPNR